MSQNRPSILGISFDGLGISGIVNEFLNVANVLRDDEFRVLFDLGYDITLGRTRDLGDAFLPSWVEPIRCIGAYPKGYDVKLIDEACSTVLSGIPISKTPIYDDVLRRLVSSLVGTSARENVRFLTVENGTLPDNPLFTEALYLAIAEYGRQRKLHKYVMWRDHDLMWSAEPHLYGSYPYPGVHKPAASEYIEYFVATDWMRTRMRAWAPGVTYHVLPNRFLTNEVQYSKRRSLREAYVIRKDAYLVARCTRVVPQKAIERDVRLLPQLQLRLQAAGNLRKVFLFVSGPTQEDPNEFRRLRALASQLSVDEQIIWGDGLLSFNPFMTDLKSSIHRFSVRDLLAEADLSSFLTVFDYEGFGNPPGEAMAVRVPFISTTYELYHEVYGRRGAIAPLLSIDRTSNPSDPLPSDFVEWTVRLLTDDAYQEQVVNRNLEVCRRFFSLDALDRQLQEVFGRIH